MEAETALDAHPRAFGPEEGTPGVGELQIKQKCIHFSNEIVGGLV